MGSPAGAVGLCCGQNGKEISVIHTKMMIDSIAIMTLYNTAIKEQY